MESEVKIAKRRDSLYCVNNFIARLNKKLVTCSKTSMKIACNAMAAILDKNKELIRKFAEDGLPDDLPMLRAYIWKILLNYLPEDIKKWEETLNEKRTQYSNYKKFIEKKLEKEVKEKKYKSRDTLEQIIKDVYRTNTQIAFFYEPTKIKNVKKLYF